MKHRIALCAGLTALVVAAATSAPAQTYLEPPPGAVPSPPPSDYGAPPPSTVHDGMPPSQALMIARTSGLRPLTQPARRGPNWVLLASDGMGGQLRVVINARTGRIVHAAPAHDPRFAYGEPPARPRGLVPIMPPQYAAAPPSYGGALPPPDLNTPTPPLPRTGARSTPPQTQPATRTARTSPPQTPPAAATQNSSVASAPDTTGSVPSRPAARTPLPRPRPTMAANEAGAGAAAPMPRTQARQVVETSPEAEASSTPAAAAAAPSATPPAPAKQAPTETQMVPVAPLD